MAMSMFLRNTACTSRMFSQQLLRAAPAPVLRSSGVSTLAITNATLKQMGNKSLLNAVRTFRTSPMRLAVEKSHDHSRLWVIERAVSASLVVMMPLGLMMPNKLFDSILAILITAHSFWGLEAIAVDYVRPLLFGPILPKVALALVYLVSAATLGGLFYVISHDIGIANTVRQLWAIKAEQKA